MAHFATSADVRVLTGGQANRPRVDPGQAEEPFADGIAALPRLSR